MDSLKTHEQLMNDYSIENIDKEILEYINKKLSKYWSCKLVLEQIKKDDYIKCIIKEYQQKQSEKKEDDNDEIICETKVPFGFELLEYIKILLEERGYKIKINNNEIKVSHDYKHELLNKYKKSLNNSFLTNFKWFPIILIFIFLFIIVDLHTLYIEIIHS